MKVRVIHNQSLLDLSIQIYGSITEVVALAVANNISITANLEPNTIIEAPVIEVSEPTVQDYYQRKRIKPATALSTEDIFNTNPEGIGYMIIETNFIVK